MIGFLIKKTFYDLWDNMFKIVAVNLGFIAAAAIPIFLPGFVARFINSAALEMALSALGILICSVYLAAAAVSIKSISDYSSFSFGDFFSGFKIAWPAGLVVGFLIFLLYTVVTIILPFYMAFESSVGLVLAAVIFWATVFAMLSFQYFFTVYIRLGSNRIYISFKKCMLVSLDNSGFSFFLFLHNIVVLIISVIFFFLFPGPAGILLYLDEALRLRLLKYDWLEANPGADRRKIPWDAILIGEREKNPSRTLRNFIFPWKD
jgi:hypothetical protein